MKSQVLMSDNSVAQGVVAINRSGQSGFGDVYQAIPDTNSAAELAALPPEYHREPRLGLAGGESGLDLVLRILHEAPRYLTEDGVLILEVGMTALALEALFPEIPFMWIEFERGGEGVFLLDRARLLEFQPLFARELTRP